MTTGAQIGTARSRLSGAWAVLCLLLGVFAFGFLATPASADVHAPSLQVVSSLADSHPDCDGEAPGIIDHCHTSIACFGYAQASSSPISFDVAAPERPEATPQEHLTSRSLQPNLQPPKRSIQI